jgi:hypothetical protein
MDQSGDFLVLRGDAAFDYNLLRSSFYMMKAVVMRWSFGTKSF